MLAELAKLMKLVRWVDLTPAPVKLLNWRACLEVESYVFDSGSMKADKVRTDNARMQRRAFI